MLLSAIYRILCVACLLYANFQLCCATNEVVDEQTARMICMENCSHLTKDSTTQLSSEIWNHQSCFKQCLRNFGKDNFVRKHRGKDGFRRSKRETLDPFSMPEQDNCWRGFNACRILAYQKHYAIPEENISITFQVYSGRVYASISWNPPSAHLKRFRVIYFKGSEGYQRCCFRDVNKTSMIAFVHNSSNGFLGEGPYVNGGVLPLPLKDSKQQVQDHFKHATFKLTTDKPAGTTGTASTSTDVTVMSTTDKPADYMSREVLFILVVVVSITVMLALLAYWYFCHKREPKGSYYVGVNEMEFDAFIIYSTPDEEWVKTTLLPILEEKNALKCCVHYRDFTIGKSFRENMAESVYKSRKTIAVVSHSFFKSKYCNHEMEIALGRLVERGDDSVIVIKLDDVDGRKLPKALKQRSYIDYFRSNDGETWAKQLIRSIKVSVKHKANCTSFV